MSCETLCCICLENECTYLTECCKNKIHKQCIIQWLIYKGIFNCPLCRSKDIRVPINDLLTTQYGDYGLTSSEIVLNLNKLLTSYNTPYHITIDIPDQRYSQYSCSSCFTLTRYTRYRLRGISLNCKTILCLLCIPLFYGLLFFLMNNYYIPKKIEYVDD
jgi:hypothetical protein